MEALRGPRQVRADERGKWGEGEEEGVISVHSPRNWEQGESSFTCPFDSWGKRLRVGH